MYRTHSSSTNDLSSYDHYLRSNQITNSPLSPASKQYYHNNSYENYCQQYSRMSPATFQQYQNEQHFLHLSLANNQSQTPCIQSPTNHQSHPGTPLDADEQQLLNAIHAHPNKRDLVLNLLRQMNQPGSSIDQQRHSDPSPNYKP